MMITDIKARNKVMKKIENARVDPTRQKIGNLMIPSAIVGHIGCLGFYGEQENVQLSKNRRIIYFYGAEGVLVHEQYVDAHIREWFITQHRRAR